MSRISKPPHFISVYCDHIGACVIRYDTIGREYLIKECWHNKGSTSFEKVKDICLDFSKGFRVQLLMNNLNPLMGLLRKYSRENKFVSVDSNSIELLDCLTTLNSLFVEERVKYEKDIPDISKALESFDIEVVDPIVYSLLYGIGITECQRLTSELSRITTVPMYSPIYFG